MKRVDYIGRKFGKLTVLSREDRYINNRMFAFLFCKCECGIEKFIRYNNLVNGQTSSCGCLQKANLSKRSRKSKGHASTHSVWGYYRRNSKLRNLEWNLTKDQFLALISLPCYYCGTKDSMSVNMAYGDSCLHNGVDRLDNSLGYTVNNSVPCCNICNRAKGILSVAEFLKWIKLFTEERVSGLFHKR